MKKIVILSAGPGLPEIVKLHGHSSEWIPNLLSSNNLDFAIKNVYNNDKCSVDDGDIWIITGSKYSVYENIPWINNLVNFVKSLIENKKPVLGICFGHQVIAKSIGAGVIKNPLGWELGSYSLNLTKLGLNHELFSGISNHDIVYESHQDIVVNLPVNAKLLADTDKSIQSFQYNDNVYGVQFHPEFSWEVTRMLMDLRIDRGISVDNNLLEKSINGHKILNNFINIV